MQKQQGAFDDGAEIFDLRRDEHVGVQSLQQFAFAKLHQVLTARCRWDFAGNRI